MSISSTIKSIQDIMRKDVGVDGDAQRIGQLVWMFFLKIYDDKESEYELLDDHYRSPIPEPLRWRNWAANPEGITGDELLDFINIQLFPTLKNLQPAHDDKRGFVIRSVFEDAYNYMKSGHLMRQVINKIVGGVDFNKAQDRHLFGDLYEQILRDLQNAGNAGEYYTPRPVTQFIVDMVNPQLGEKILDPACGTGGFLTCSIEYVRKQQVKTVEDEQRLQQSIHGVEKKPLPHLLCTTNMILHGLDVPTNVRHDNTLARPLRDYGPKDRVDVIVTNPPFGGMEEDGIENNFPATFRTRETADLFLVLIMHLLKDGGRAALVLPDGTLFGEGIKTRIKEQLLNTCNLHTIVRLPNGVFAPYTGIKTNLLFFTKGTPTQDVWFYEHPYPPGVKNYNKTKPMRIEEFAAEKAWWGGNERSGRVENEYAWKVSADDIKARNYNLDIKNPHSPDAVIHDPEELLADYAALQLRIAGTRDQLRTVLTTALEDTQRRDASELSANWQRLSQHFDTLFSTEASLDALKQTILQLAVMGKLVPQDPNDEPASALLKRIAAKKIRMVTESKLRTTADECLSDKDRYMAIPSGWEFQRLGNLAKFIDYRGRTPKKIKAGVPLITAKNVRFGFISREPREFIAETEYAEWMTRGFPRIGDILFTTEAPLGNVATVDIEERFALAQRVICFQLHEPAIANHVKLTLMAEQVRDQIGAEATGMTATGIKASRLKEIPIPIPPLAEQLRIVAKVNELMTLCDRLKTDLAESSTRQARLSATLIDAALQAA